MEHIWTFFAFPLNILAALLWMVSWGLLWKSHSQCAIVKFLLSPAATVSAFVLLIIAGLSVGFTGNRDLVSSIPFVVLLLYVQTVVYLVILRGWRRKEGAIRWRFLLIHAGFLLAVGAGFWGSPDSSEVRLKLICGQESRNAYKMDGCLTALDYELSLLDHRVDLSDDGKPSYYEAIVSINDGDSEVITVNHPFSVSLAEDIYLASVTDSGCVFQIVREPWRYFALAGILMLLTGAFLLFIKGPRR